MQQECSVYIIGIVGSDLCKIGISSDPKKRLAQLLTASPVEMEIVHVFKLPNRLNAAAIEQAFHGVFRRQRARGEWFKISRHEAKSAMIENIIMFLKVMARLSGDRLTEAVAAVGLPDGFGGLIEITKVRP